MAKVETLPLLDPDTSFGVGGFGSLYTDPRNPTQCIKVLKSPLLGEDATALGRLVDVARWARPSVAHILKTRFAWPLEIFGSESEVKGYVMPLAPASTNFELNTLGRTQTKTLQAKFICDADYWNSAAIRSQPPPLSVGDRIEIILDLYYSLQVLHQNGLVYGDISSNNIAIRVEDWPGVFLFDADSISTVSRRSASPLITPGWETADGLGPLEIDRARFSLFVIRILQQKSQAFPEGDQLRIFGGSFGTDLADSCATLYRTGSAEELDLLIQALRRRRDVTRADAALKRAEESGFARFVLREAEHARTREDQRLLDIANNQVMYEAVVEGTAGQKRRDAASRETLQRSGFVLDVTPTFSLPEPPKTAKDLEDLIYKGIFIELASHRAAEGFDALESHSWISRAVEHALIEVAGPEVSVAPEVGKATIRIWWPPDQFINSIMLRVHLNQSYDPIVFRRGDNNNQIIHVIEDPRGGDLRVEVVGGSITANGVLIVWSPQYLVDPGPSNAGVLSPQWVVVVTKVDPVPAPVAPRTAVGRTEPARPTLMARIFDPEEERQRLLSQRLQEEADQRRRRRTLILRVAALIIGLIPVGLGAWWLFSGSPEELAAPLGVTATPTADLTLEIAGPNVIARWERSVGPGGERPVGHEIQWLSEVQRGRPVEVAGPEAFSIVSLPQRAAVVFQVRPFFSDGSRGQLTQSPLIVLGADRRANAADQYLSTGIFGAPSLLISESGVSARFKSGAIGVPDQDAGYRVVWLNGSGQSFFRLVSEDGLYQSSGLVPGETRVDVQRAISPGAYGPRASSRSVTFSNNHPIFAPPVLEAEPQA